MNYPRLFLLLLITSSASADLTFRATATINQILGMDVIFEVGDTLEMVYFLNEDSPATSNNLWSYNSSDSNLPFLDIDLLFNGESVLATVPNTEGEQPGIISFLTSPGEDRLSFGYDGPFSDSYLLNSDVRTSFREYRLTTPLVLLATAQDELGVDIQAGDTIGEVFSPLIGQTYTPQLPWDNLELLFDGGISSAPGIYADVTSFGFYDAGAVTPIPEPSVYISGSLVVGVISIVTLRNKRKSQNCVAKA